MTAGLQTVGLALSDNPNVVIVVLDLLIAEVGKKRPSDALCEALLFMMGQVLDETRMAVEGGSEPAINLIAEVREKLVTAAERGHLPPEVMMVIGQQFAAAKLDLGDELRALTLALSEQAASHGPALSSDDITSHYAAMAEAFDHDPFLIHGQLSEQLVQ